MALLWAAEIAVTGYEATGAAGIVCGIDASAKLLGVSMFETPALLGVSMFETPALLGIDAFAGVSASLCLYLAFVAREPLAWLRDPIPA